MKPKSPLCLGGGHGVRAYLPQELQRFSIDLDFYSNDGDVHNILREVSGLRDLKPVGYGAESEGRFKRYDSAVPAELKRCTVALLKRYIQSFKSGDVDPEFYVTVSNTLAFGKYEMRKPKSYIGVEYVKEEVPVLSPALIIASKVRIIPHRKVKDLYKDVFDIYALFNSSDISVDDSEIIAALSATGSRVRKPELFQRFKETSDPRNARNAIKLPSESRRSYLEDWKSMNAFVKKKAITVLEGAGMLDG
ncbi:MAG TPA: nucleotidyl transferase AbiEii/AbiGii toxin family protein [Nitrososphaerales archaeon]|nr:nucleotidyl transferase AbiEii/AbiGii toxin family protein [Nitrososphaerales archaeon]